MVILERDGVINHRPEEDIIAVEGWAPIAGSSEAIKRLNADVEVILCTGYGEKEEVATLVKDEHLHFLPKPFTIETLEDKIKTALSEVKV